MTKGYPTLTTLQRSQEALMNSERHTQTIYEVFRDGKPKYQLIWTNNTKRFLIDGKIVSEKTWTKTLKKDKP
jgi:hypothetical protein